MEDSDESEICTTTIGDQVEKVKHLTKNSKVQEFGDLSLRDEFIGNFQGV
jgi:hypothetical protein